MVMGFEEIGTTIDTPANKVRGGRERLCGRRRRGEGREGGQGIGGA